jgi:hypothetical protein
VNQVAFASLAITVDPGSVVPGRSMGIRQWDGNDVTSPGYSYVFSDTRLEGSTLTATAGLYKLNAVDPQLEVAWFQPLNL